MNTTIILSNLAITHWPETVAVVVVLVISIGARTFIAGARSVLTKWVGAKIEEKTGMQPDVASGLAGGMKSVLAAVRGNWFFWFMVGNALIAWLIVVVLTHVEHSGPQHPTPNTSHSASSTRS